MAESFICSQCGHSTSKWLGQCPQCNEWNTLVVQADSGVSGGKKKVKPAQLLSLSEVTDKSVTDYIPLSSTEFNRVLGGGVVPGQVCLLSGEPGVGKSTFLLSQLAALAISGQKVVYVAGEESTFQVKQRLDRLQTNQKWPEDKLEKNLFIIGNTDIQKCLVALQKKSPDVVAFDSVQSFYLADVSSVPGSMAQVRNVGQLITEWSKRNNTVSFIIGQITKSGSIAGPKILEHLVDTVLYLEIVDIEDTRIIRSLKNRFGATDEVGFFSMTSGGVEDKEKVDHLFAREEGESMPGSSIGITVHGNRPLAVEVQALALDPQYQSVRRVVEGVPKSRVELIIAVLSRFIPSAYLPQKDVFVKVTGGLKIKDPGLDLAIAAAILSSVTDKALPNDVVFIGELGLLGNILPSRALKIRLQEAGRVSAGIVYTNKTSSKDIKGSAKVKQVKRIDQIHTIIKG